MSDIRVSTLVLVDKDNNVVARDIMSDLGLGYHPFPYAKVLEMLELEIQAYNKLQPSEDYFESDEYADKCLVMKIKPKN